MTVTYLGAGIHVGTSGDTKPANVPENSLFVETDTFSLYILLSSVWTIFPTVTASDGVTTITTDTQANETLSESIADIVVDTQDTSTPTESASTSTAVV